MPPPVSRPLPPSRLLLAGMLASILAACSSETPQAPPPPEVVVQTVTAERLTIDQALSGRTVAYMSSEVRPQVGGILRARLFEEGQTVTAGEVLYEIEPATYQSALDAARADLAQAQATVQAARPRAERLEALVELDAVSRQEGDDATATLQQGEAAVLAARAALQSAQINLDFTRITAPISGRIGTSHYTPGALVSAGQADVLATIQQLDPMYVDVTQSSSQLLALRRMLESGQLKAVHGKAEVRIVLEDGTTYAHAGTLEVVEPRIDPTTGTVLLRAIVPNPDQMLVPGMYVRAALGMAVDERAILVPQQAVTRNAKGEAQALVLAADDTVEQRVLRTGDAVGNRWRITDGLAAGDRLIIEGGARVRPGMTVRVSDAAAATQPGAQPAAASPTPAAASPTPDAAGAAPRADATAD